MKADKTCKACEHWKRNEVNTYDAAWGGRCGSEKFVYDSDPPNDGLSYEDYEGYSAYLKTGENFGCIHWHGKDRSAIKARNESLVTSLQEAKLREGK